MKPLYSCTSAMLMILAGGALFRPHMMKAGPGSAKPSKSTDSPAATATQKSRLAENYGKLPLGFEANEGQTDSRVKFLARGRGYSLFLTGDEAVLTLQRPKVKAGVAPTGSRPNPVGRSANAGLKFGATTAVDKPTTDHGQRTADSVLRMRLVGANARATATGADELPGKINYFIGNDPKKWRTNVPNYAKVKYHNVYPGVDLVYYGNQGGQLEYDFVVAPGADPAAIRFALSGGMEVGSRQPAVSSGTQNPTASQSKFQNLKSKIDANGDIVVKTDGGEIRFHKPVVYQEQSKANRPQSRVQDEIRNSKLENRQSSIGNRQLLEGHYVLQTDNQIGFQIASYDHTQPLIIDPTLSYSTYVDGSGTDSIGGIAVDSQGNVYLTGSTTSPDFPTTTGALQPTFPGGTAAYIAKLNPTATAFYYATFLGGSGGFAQGDAIALDPSGNTYIAGFAANGFPITPGAYQTTLPSDVSGGYFVASINATGSALVYSTWFGTSAITSIHIAADASWATYLTGTYSPSLAPSTGAIPTTPGAFQPNPPPVGVDYPNTPGYPAPPSCLFGTPGCYHAFVSKLNPTGTALVYSTYLGGSGDDEANAIAVDSNGNAYVTGSTTSYFPAGEGASLPTTPGAFQVIPPIPLPNCANINGLPCYNGQILYLNSAFVTKFDPTGNLLLFTFLDAQGTVSGKGITFDSNADIYVTGDTTSPNFPTTSGAFQTALGGIQNIFVTKFNPTLSAPVYSTYLGGGGTDYASGIAVDSAGEAYVTGWTSSTNFPAVNPSQTMNQGGYNGLDVFVSELNPGGSGLVFSTYLGGNDDDYASGIGVDSTDFNVYIAGHTFSTNFPTTPGAFQQTQTVTPCIHMTPGLVPFTQTYSIGNGYELGLMSPSAYAGMLALANPSVANQGFCEPVQLAVGGPYISSVAVPTAAERQGNFSSLPQITNPITGQPYAGNIIPPPVTQASPFAWPLNGISVGGPSTFVAKYTLSSQVSLHEQVIAFLNWVVRSGSTPQTETVTNTGTDNLTISSVTIGGANPGDFTTSADTCTGALVAPNGTCTINVTFTPLALGDLSASLIFTDNASNSPQTVPLTGTGTAPLAGLSLSNLTFSGQNVGTTSAPQPVTLSNTGTAALTITSIITSANFGETDNCNGSVAASGSCVINVTFAPTALGMLTGTLTINDNNNAVAGSTQFVNLIGIGDEANMSVEPSTLNFGNQALSVASAVQSVTVTDAGTGSLSTSTVTVSGTNASDFAKSVDTCSGATVAPNATCTVGVIFTPSAIGSRSASLIFLDNNNGVAGSTQTVTLTGTGTARVSTTTVTVTSGGGAVTTVPSGSAVTLTASVNIGAAAVTLGQVKFCDATAAFCTDIHLLGTAQLTSAGTAEFKFRPGIGSHSYEAVFLGSSGGAESSSSASALTVTGLFPTTTTIAASGNVGNYTVTSTVTGSVNRAGLASPTGTVSFLDTSNENYPLGTAALGSGIAGLNWLNSQTPATGTNPASIAVGDFNGDGIPDLAMANFNDNNAGTVTILLGNGGGVFTATPVSPTTGVGPSSIAVGDFNGDGIPDLAIANSQDCTLTILLGNGDGTFVAAASPATGCYPWSVAVGDFNGDGNMDLAVASTFGGASGSVTILLGNGNGTFTAQAVRPATGIDPLSIAVGDFNGDGIPDLAVANHVDPGTVTVLLGNGDGTFTAAASPATGAFPESVAVGDFNGDGNADLAVANSNSSSVTVLLGNGNGTFTPVSVSPATGVAPYSVAVGDFNGDGIPDLAVANAGSSTVTVLLGNGNGTFTATSLSPNTGSGAEYVTVSDFNGDGIPDLAVANYNGNTLTVLLTQLTQTASATESGISPVGTGTHLVEASYPGDTNYIFSLSSATAITGTAAIPVGGVSPPSLTFSAQNLGTTSASQPITLSNTGTAALTITQISTSLNFGETNTCGASVAVGATCTINVTFTPTVPGSLSGTLTIADNNNGVAGSTQFVNLIGIGTEASISIAPGNVNFGNQTVDVASAVQSVTVTNVGTGSLSTTTATVSGTNAGDFAKSVDTCSGATVAPNATCTVGVMFTPSAIGSRSASLIFIDNNNGVAGSTQTVPLTGTGTGPLESLSSYSLTFPAQISGTTSTAQTVTVTNSGNANLTFTTISAASPFAIATSGTTCSTSSPVAAAGTCAVAVTFAPTAGGSASGNLSFADNASGSPQTVALAGTGQDFSFAPPSGSSTSATAAPGGTATYTLSVGGEGGLSGTVSFAITGAPSEATCAASPNPAALGTNVAVTCATTAPSADSPRSRPLPPVPPLSPGLKDLLMLALILAAMAWATLRRNQPGVSRWKAAMVSLALGLLLSMGLAGCHSGGTTTTMSNPGTPAGTYTLTVTGTASSGSSAVSHSVMLTLIVS